MVIMRFLLLLRPSRRRGNRYRNNDFYVICKGILLTLELRVIAGRGLNEVPSAIMIERRAKNFIGSPDASRTSNN